MLRSPWSRARQSVGPMEALVPPAALDSLPAGTDGPGATPAAEGRDVTSRPSAMPALGIESGGSLPSPAPWAGSSPPPRRQWRNRTLSQWFAASAACPIPRRISCPIDLDVKYTCLVRPRGRRILVRTASARAASSAKCSPGATAPGRTLGEPDSGVPPVARVRPGCRRTPLGAGSRPRCG